MSRWRGAVAALLLLLIAAPLLPPFLELADSAAWRWSDDDLARVARLAVNTLLLVAGTDAVALALGVPLAVLLFRTRLPGRRWFRGLLLHLLFVPLPTIVSSWQALLGQEGLWPVGWWRTTVDRPWTTGFGPAIWIHALAALPWVVWLVGLSLRQVEPELEEEALLRASPWRVLWQVTLPRSRAGIVAALAFVSLLTANEITVTDMLLVSTLAEEVHTQFTLGQRDALARTLVLALPFLAATWGGLALIVARLERSLPPLPTAIRSARPLVAGPSAAWLTLTAVCLAAGLLPLLSLAWKVGLAGQPPAWSFAQTWVMLRSEASLYGGPVVQSVLVAFLTGLLAAGLALVCTWLAAESRGLRGLLLFLLTLAWVLPGPLVGIALHQTILALVTALPRGPWTVGLYDGPSPLPVVWVQAIRFLPAAVFFLWPVVRLIPTPLREAARAEGASPLRELFHLILPLTWREAGVTSLAVGALCLGEVGASTRVETPGWETFAKLLFDRMHYGVEGNVAALSLLLLGGIVASFLIASLLIRLRAR